MSEEKLKGGIFEKSDLAAVGSKGDEMVRGSLLCMIEQYENVEPLKMPDHLMRKMSFAPDPIKQAITLMKILVHDPRIDEKIRRKYKAIFVNMGLMSGPEPDAETVKDPVWLIKWKDGGRSLISNNNFITLKGDIWKTVKGVEGWIGLSCAREKYPDMPYIE